MRYFSIFLLTPLLISCNENKSYSSPNVEYKIMTKDNYTTTEYSTWDKKLIIRCISKDSYNLKFAINKILSYFFENSQIPRIWNI